MLMKRAHFLPTQARSFWPRVRRTATMNFLFPAGTTPEHSRARVDTAKPMCGERAMRGLHTLVQSLFSRLFVLAASVLLMVGALAQAAEPIKIGFGVSLTGGLASSGKAHLLAMQIWAEEVNAKGGLLGRPVQIIYYDDQTNAANVPAIYAKLLDIDKVDLLISSYGTNLVVPAMPVAISHNRLFFGLFALAANDKFHYPKYFSMRPFGRSSATRSPRRRASTTKS